MAVNAIPESILQPNPLPYCSTPAGVASGVASNILCVRYGPTVRPVLSTQREFNRTEGILRGRKDYAGRLMMDHVIGLDGRTHFGAAMRLGTISVWEHQIRLLSSSAGQGQRILAVVGNGNLTQNPYFVAWHREGGLLVRLKGEPVGDRAYDCLVVDGDGARGASVRRVRFVNRLNNDDEGGWLALDVSTSKELTSAELIFSGQRVVTGGRPLSQRELNEQVISGSFYDLRHVFRFPAVRSDSYWKDLGLEGFYDHGMIDQAAVRRALNHQPMRIRWRDLTDDRGLVIRAFEDKGCREDQSGSPGTYAFDDDFVDVVFHEALYCHNVLGLDQDGMLYSMQVTGKSNNVGSTLADLSALAAKVFHDAILLDNGGDVFFLVNQEPDGRIVPFSRLGDRAWTWVPSCENRYQIRSVILFVAEEEAQDAWVEPVRPSLH